MSSRVAAAAAASSRSATSGDRVDVETAADADETRLPPETPAKGADINRLRLDEGLIWLSKLRKYSTTFISSCAAAAAVAAAAADEEVVDVVVES